MAFGDYGPVNYGTRIHAVYEADRTLLEHARQLDAELRQVRSRDATADPARPRLGHPDMLPDPSRPEGERMRRKRHLSPNGRGFAPVPGGAPRPQE